MNTPLSVLIIMLQLWGGVIYPRTKFLPYFSETAQNSEQKLSTSWDGRPFGRNTHGP